MTLCVLDGKHCECQPDIQSYCRRANERIAELEKYAAIGHIVFKYIDRMNDIAPDCGDGAERILNEFVEAVMPSIHAALPKL